MSAKSEIVFQIPGTVFCLEITQSPESIFLRVFDLLAETEIHREMMTKIPSVPPPLPMPDPPSDTENRYRFDLET